MSGIYYQTYDMHRLDSKLAKEPYPRNSCSPTVRVGIPRHLEPKIRRISRASRIPEEVIVAEAIRRGMEMLAQP
jgi:hypothetical protein